MQAITIIAVIMSLTLCSCRNSQPEVSLRPGEAWTPVVVQSVKPLKSDGKVYLFELRLKEADGNTITADADPQYVNAKLLSAGKPLDIVITQPHGYAADRYRARLAKEPSNKSDPGDS